VNGSKIESNLEEIDKSGIDSTIEKRVTFKRTFFDSKEQFLNFCEINYLQFDELRRAKHSSMMILYTLHNSFTLDFPNQCDKKSFESPEQYNEDAETYLDLLAHAISCPGSLACSSGNCGKMKLLLNHLKRCNTMYTHGCKACIKYFSLLEIHCRDCSVPHSCPFPFCDLLRKRKEGPKGNQSDTEYLKCVPCVEQNELHRFDVVNSIANDSNTES